MLAVLMWFFVEIAALHLTFLFTLDANIFLEIGAAAYLLAARGRAGQMIGAAVRSIALGLHKPWQFWRRHASRQHRNRNALRRHVDDSPPSDDEPAIGAGYAFA